MECRSPKPTARSYAFGMDIQSHWSPRPRAKRYRRDQAAFSLLELMIVMGLVSVLMGLVTPALAAQSSERDRLFAVQQLYAELHRARLTAVTQQHHLTVCPSRSGKRCDSTNQWHWGWIAFVDTDKSGQPRDPNAILVHGEAQPSLKITSGGRQRVRFQPQGTAYGNNLTLRFCVRHQAGKATALIVSNPGRIRLTQEKACV